MEFITFLNRYCTRKTRARLALIYKKKEWLSDAEWLDDNKDKLFKIGNNTIITVKNSDYINIVSHLSTSALPKKEIIEFVRDNFIECAAIDEDKIKINIDKCKCFAFTMKHGNNIGIVEDDKINWLF